MYGWWLERCIPNVQISASRDKICAEPNKQTPYLPVSSSSLLSIYLLACEDFKLYLHFLSFPCRILSLFSLEFRLTIFFCVLIIFLPLFCVLCVIAQISRRTIRTREKWVRVTPRLNLFRLRMQTVNRWARPLHSPFQNEFGNRKHNCIPVWRSPPLRGLCNCHPLTSFTLLPCVCVD